MISLNEIKERANHFAITYKDAKREKSESQTFWNDFFNVFGIIRKKVATFEEPVKKLNNKDGFIDLFWKGKLIIEQKSLGKSLDDAILQANDYCANLKPSELPRYLLACDFLNFRLIDLEQKYEKNFRLDELADNIDLFGFISGYEKRIFKDQDPINIEACKIMADLHDRLVDIGYVGREMEMFLIRLLFVFFADDTGIFERDLFWDYLDKKTNEDGSDLGSKIAEVFQILDTPKHQRMKTIDEDLDRFPYTNGDLFSGNIKIVSFNSSMRVAILQACEFDWSRISPAIFGSLFQYVMDKEARREFGAHYTTETDILKTIEPLFLDDLKAEFEKVKHNNKKLVQFHEKIGKLTFFDPACGCGNFLIIAYREIRLLEIEVMKLLHKNQDMLDVEHFAKIDVDSFFGIEIENFSAKIAEVAMWIVDHQMNMELSKVFGQYFVRIPLKKSAKIVCGNSLHLDWSEQIAPPEKISYILGNPPFVGKQFATALQKQDMDQIFAEYKGSFKQLDYVCCWYLKTAKYIANTEIKCAFVSTNSIAQGEQVPLLWQILFGLKIKIHFAHQTFAWNVRTEEEIKIGAKAKKAAVHCVIIGFANFEIPQKKLYLYDDIKGMPAKKIVDNISPYLTAGPDIFVTSRNKPICDVPEMSFGNMPNDGGGLIIDTQAELDEILANEPELQPYINPFIGAQEMINDEQRWIFWLKEASPKLIANSKILKKRLEIVKQHRLASKNEIAVKFAEIPSLLFSDRQILNRKYICVPRVSSENRKYIPIAIFNTNTVVGDSCIFMPDFSLYHFGILTSKLHNAWLKGIGGKLESRPRYSINIVYNNFIWPEATTKQQEKIIAKTQAVLDAREVHKDCSLADLYNTVSMPANLIKAHNELDKEVEKLYREEPFENDLDRVGFLLELYKNRLQPMNYEKINKNKK